MSLILLSIPDASDGMTGMLRDALPKALVGDGPRIEGEATVGKWENMILVENVSYNVEVEAEMHLEGRRTVHLPRLSPITLTRKVDRASVVLTRALLTARVSKKPWSLYFFKPLAQDAPQLYMSIKLHRALVRSQTVNGESELSETLIVGATAVEWQYSTYKSDQSKRGNTGFKFDVQSGMVM